MSTTTTIIEPGRIERNYWRDLWRYRELFQALAWRDLAVRYKQTAIGVAWAVIRPLATMIILTVIFGKVAKLPTEANVRYPLLVLVGMLPWTFFSTALSDAANSLVTSANLITKVYFPRLIVPAATIVVALADLLISFAILALMMIYYQYAPGWQLILLPLFVALAFIASLGPGLWITAVTVRYRDFRYVLPFITQFGLYISPVGFSSSVIPAKWRLLYSLNPIVGVIDGFRWSILRGQTSIYWPGFALSVVIALVMLWIGIRKFRSTERSFADLI